MGIESINIFFQDKTLFYSGEIVNGICQVVASSLVEEPHFIISFVGKAKVKWSEKKGDHYRHYSEKIILLNLQHYVKFANGRLDAGQHQFPFTFTLPRDLVTSFEHDNAYVRYFVRGEFPSSWLSFFDEKEIRAPVRILQPIDANLPEYTFAVKGNDEVSPCCCCCAEGSVTAEAEIDRAAYCPNERVSVTASFSNNSSRSARPYAKIVQKVKAFARGHKRSWLDRIKLEPVENVDGDVLAEIARGKTARWNGVYFVMPPVSPSITLPILQVSYHIEVGMDIPMAFDAEVVLPVVVGTIPFRGGTASAVTMQPMVEHNPPGRSVAYQAPPVGWQGLGRRMSRNAEPSAPPVQSIGSSYQLQESPPDYFQTILTNPTWPNTRKAATDSQVS